MSDSFPLDGATAGCVTSHKVRSIAGYSAPRAGFKPYVFWMSLLHHMPDIGGSLNWGIPPKSPDSMLSLLTDCWF